MKPSLPFCAPGVVPVQRLQLARGPCRAAGEPLRHESARKLVHALRRHLNRLPQEVLVVVLLDLERRVVGAVEVAVGGIEEVSVDSRLVLGVVMTRAVVDYIVLHSHPRARARPTREDDQLVRNLAEKSESLGLRLVDSVIAAGDGGVFSYKETGRMRRVVASSVAPSR